MTALEPVGRFGGNEFDFRSFRGRSFDGGDQALTQKEAMILKVLVEPDPEPPRFFRTVRGIGYRFVAAGEESGS